MVRFFPKTYTGQKATEDKYGVMKYANSVEALDTSNSEVALSPARLDGYLSQAGFMQYADVTLTSTEVKALAASPQTLVEAQGAGTVIKLLGAVFKLNYGGSNAFTETDDNLLIKYTDGSGVAVTGDIEMTNFIDATADTYTNAEPVIDAIVAASGAENEPLVLDNPDDEIAGNAADDNTLVVRVYYTVQSL